MKYFIGALIATVFWLLLLWMIPMPDDGIRFYDCGMAEWHPDVPREVREECRRQRAQPTTKGINI